MKMRPGEQTGFLLCGKEWIDGEALEVRSPWDQGLVGRVSIATRADARQAVNHAVASLRRTRALLKTVAKYNQAPFVLVRETQRQTIPNWRELLNTVKSEGTREVNVQRYKGLGEMNAEQLWETTMNIEKRTLLQVDLHDFAIAEPIFSTLMGEDVESRRRFIEDNALDVRNLDV